MSELPADPYQCPACDYTKKVIYTCVEHLERTGLAAIFKPSQLTEQLTRRSETARDFAFVCSPRDFLPPETSVDAAPRRREAAEPVVVPLETWKLRQAGEPRGLSFDGDDA